MNNSLHEQTESFDKLKGECGVFGIYDFDGNNVASTIYYGLFALQHRGQESCGIAVSDTNGPKEMCIRDSMRMPAPMHMPLMNKMARFIIGPAVPTAARALSPT